MADEAVVVPPPLAALFVVVAEPRLLWTVAGLGGPTISVDVVVVGVARSSDTAEDCDDWPAQEPPTTPLAFADYYCMVALER